MSSERLDEFRQATEDAELGWPVAGYVDELIDHIDWLQAQVDELKKELKRA